MKRFITFCGRRMLAGSRNKERYFGNRQTNLDRWSVRVHKAQRKRRPINLRHP